MASQSDVTQLLLAWRAGDPQALEALIPQVLDELRRIARRCFGRERADHSLQPTALVNEAYLRLVKASAVDWRSRAQFFGVAARLMRQVLVDHARSRDAEKRGGGVPRTSVDVDLIPRSRDVDLVALDDALSSLSRIDPRGSEVVELRFFAGLTLAEVGEALGVSRTTAKRKWTSARAWLLRELRRGAAAPAGGSP